jgi:hypothetical protein
MMTARHAITNAISHDFIRCVLTGYYWGYIQETEHGFTRLRPWGREHGTGVCSYVGINYEYRGLKQSNSSEFL